MQTIMKFILTSLLVLPLFANATTIQDVQEARVLLEPHVLKIAGVEGSMIGGCIKGTDQDPFINPFFTPEEIDPCLVFFVRSEEMIPRVKNEYKALGISTVSAVRFQKTPPELHDQ